MSRPILASGGVELRLVFNPVARREHFVTLLSMHENVGATIVGRSETEIARLIEK